MRRASNEPRIPMTRVQIIRLLQGYHDLARQILTMLPEREAYVLKRLYGLGEATAGMKDTDLAREMGISGSRVGQIKKRGLGLLCHTSRKQVIVAYIMANIIKNNSNKTKQNILQGFAA